MNPQNRGKSPSQQNRKDESIFLTRLYPKTSVGGLLYYSGTCGTVRYIGFPTTDDEGNEVIDLKIARGGIRKQDQE